MKASQMFPSKYLKADDCEAPGMILIIASVDMEKMVDGAEKPVIHFSNHLKGLALNKTNTNTIAHSYGDESDHWVGQSLVLTSHMVSYQGKMVPGIHVQIPAQTQVQTPGNTPRRIRSSGFAEPQQPQLPEGVAEQKVATAPAPASGPVTPEVVGITDKDIPF